MVTQGISRRAYAKTRGISEAAVRAAIERGALADAVLPNGLIDATKADQLLTDVAPKARGTSVQLKAAKLRRLRAQVHRLQDEVAALRLSLTHRCDVAQCFRNSRDMLAGRLALLPDEIATRAAGLDGPFAAIAIRDCVNEALTDLSTSAVSDDVPLPDDDEVGLEGLSFGALTTIKLNLESERLEYERGLSVGVLAEQDELDDLHNEACTVSKSVVISLPGTLAPFAAGVSAAELRERATVEVQRAIQRLIDLVAAAEERAAPWADRPS